MWSFDKTLKHTLTERSFEWHLSLFYAGVGYDAANILDIVKAFVREYGGLTAAWVKLDATLRFNFGRGLGNPPPELPAASRTPPDSQDSWDESADISELLRANEPVVGGVKSVVAQHGFGNGNNPIE